MSTYPYRSADAATGIRHPGLDGLRGWAVIAVVAFHSGALHAGWVGVDVFMALSGYLITGVLINDLAAPHGLRLGRFWMRRARRLLPGLVVLLVVVLALSVIKPRGWPVATRRETFGALTYTSNWLRIFNQQSYWELFSAPSALDHLWSLAIEEQFYLIWPLIALVAWRLRGRLGVAAVALVAAVGLGGWQIWLAGHGASVERIYVGTDTRAPAFLIGAGLYALTAQRHIRASTARWMAGAGLLVVTAASFTLDGQSLSTYRGALLAVSVAGGVAAVGAARLDGLAAIDIVLTGRVIGLIGRWSYGIYLFHWPIVVLMRPYGGLALPRLCVVLGASTLLAAASFELFEHRVLTQSLNRWQRPTLIAVGVAVFVAAFAVARVPLQEVDQATAAALREPLPSVALPRSSPSTLTTPTSLPIASVSPVDSSPPTTSGAATSTALPVPARVLVVGDSVVYGLRQQLVHLGLRRNLDVAVRAAPGCTMSARPDDQNNLFSTELCSTIRDRLRDDVTRFQPDRVVAFLGGTWDPFRWQGQQFDPCSIEGQVAIAEAGDQYLADLTANDTKVALVIPPQMGGDYGASAPGAAPCYAMAYTALQDRWASLVSLAPMDTLICAVDAPTCLPDVGGVVVRKDGLHYTDEGGELVIAWLFDRIGL